MSSKDAHLILLTGKPEDMNTIDAPQKIAPQESDMHDTAASFTHEFPAYSMSVLKLDDQVTPDACRSPKSEVRMLSSRRLVRPSLRICGW